MKQFKLFAALFAVCFSFLFTSCNNNNEEVYASIVGTWNGEKVELYVNENLENTMYFNPDGEVGSITYTFSANGKYIEVFMYGGEAATESGTYTLSDDNKVLTLTDSEDKESSVTFYVNKLGEKELELEQTETTENGKLSYVYHFTRQ